ncbi:MAG: C4-dicarboxylate ABC transporter permease [Betaproteobacteria bacterium RIFCSPLOWO2_02_FULL_65_20]|nr:MAG: C4-dicarboxylate ABC transporter permease [Betaproteobacteria bacterium RIFCSPLOWO2_02_FULL_65_20]
MIVVALCALAFLMLFFGFEMLLTMGLPAVLAKLAFYPHMPDLVIAQKIMGGVNVSTLLAIPFFVFAADLMAHGVIAEKLTDMVRRLMGHYPGGVGHTTVGSCMMFGAVCGSAPATVAALGRLLFPELTRAGYSEKFALGLIAASAEVALLIPPSITLIIYGWLTGTSIAALFAGGLAVGIVLGIAYMVLVQVETWRCGARPAARPTWGERLQSLGRGFWAIGMPAVILGGIYSGGFTATEAAAVAVVYALVVELWIYRALDWKQVFRIAEESAVTTVIIFVLLAMGSLLSYFITLSDLQNVLVSFIGEHKMNWVMFLLVINAIFFVAGMFIDPNSILLVLVPTLFPVATSLGIDPVHFGLVVCLNICIGMITPPFGLDLFVASGTLKRSVETVIAGIWPFIAVNVVVLAIISYVPAISTALPKLLL